LKLSTDRAPDLQWKAQDVANAWNLDIDGFREDVAACRDLQDVLMGAGFLFFQSGTHFLAICYILKQTC
jgi:hypothetical protein